MLKDHRKFYLNALLNFPVRIETLHYNETKLKYIYICYKGINDVEMVLFVKILYINLTVKMMKHRVMRTFFLRISVPATVRKQSCYIRVAASFFDNKFTVTLIALS